MKLITSIIIFVVLLIVAGNYFYATQLTIKQIIADNNINIDIDNINTNYQLPIEDNIYHDETRYSSSDLISQAYQASITEDYPKAVDLYEKILTKDNSANYKVWHEYGWNLMKLKAYQQSGQAYGKAINRANNSETWRLLGWNYQVQGDYQKAITCYEQALLINPNLYSAITAYHTVKKLIDNTYIQQSKYIVIADPKLIYKEYPHNKANNKGSIKKDTLITVIKKSSETVSFGEKTGFWLLFMYGKKYGYVFSADVIKNNKQ
jgi:tetratricopeptide (TPR) repeat protein